MSCIPEIVLPFVLVHVPIYSSVNRCCQLVLVVSQILEY